MNELSFDIIGSIFFMVFGLLLSLFHKRIGVLAAEYQYKLFRIHFNPVGYQVSFLLAGVIFVALGILDFFQVIK